MDSLTFHELIHGLEVQHERLQADKVALDARVLALEAENRRLRCHDAEDLRKTCELGKRSGKCRKPAPPQAAGDDGYPVGLEEASAGRDACGIGDSASAANGATSVDEDGQDTHATVVVEDEPPAVYVAAPAVDAEDGRHEVLKVMQEWPAGQDGDLKRVSIPAEAHQLGAISGAAVRPSFGQDDPYCTTLPDLWPIWRNRPTNAQTEPIMSARTCVTSEFMGMYRRVTRAGDEVYGHSRMQAFVLPPNSKRRIIWDFVSFVVMSWDTMFLPLQAFYSSDDASTAWKIVDLTTSTFWTLDIMFAFFVGYHNQGLVEMRPNRIAMRYLRSWFALDFTIVSVDWILNFQFLSDSADFLGIVRVGKALRIVRVLRMIRLLRIMKVVWLLTELNDCIQSESLLTLFGIVKLTVGIAVVNHFLACSWYAVGNVSTERSTWVKVHEEMYVEREGITPTLGYRYTTSLHWSLTQFTPASMEVTPTNVIERIFAILVIVFALITFSSFVSSITAAMTHLRHINSENMKQQEQVRRYITDNKVPLNLSNRIFDFLRKYRQSNKSRVHEVDIVAFRAMPETLRMRLHVHVFMPVLLPHPFFFHYYMVDEAAPRNICHTAMLEHSLPILQELFNVGEKASKMFFVVTGGLEYTLGGVEDVEPIRLIPGDNLSEMALWLQWEHKGRLSAVQHSELVSLDVGAFHSTARRTPNFVRCQAYAQKYLNKIRNSFETEDVNDTWGSFGIAQEMAHETFDVGKATRMSSLPGLRRLSLTSTLINNMMQVPAPLVPGTAEAAGGSRSQSLFRGRASVSALR